MFGAMEWDIISKDDIDELTSVPKMIPAAYKENLDFRLVPFSARLKNLIRPQKIEIERQIMVANPKVPLDDGTDSQTELLKWYRESNVEIEPDVFFDVDDFKYAPRSQEEFGGIESTRSIQMKYGLDKSDFGM